MPTEPTRARFQLGDWASGLTGPFDLLLINPPYIATDAPLAGDVVVIDDVMTAGTAIRESMSILNELGARGAGVVIGLDRCERGDGERSAVQQVEQDWGLKVVSVVSLHDIIAWVETHPDMAQHREALEQYRERYGVA